MDLPNILHETDTFLIIEKPSGWIVNTASTTGNKPVVQDWLYEHGNYEISKDDNLRSGIAHRLDKETSGLMIVAKNEHALKNIQNQFKERTVEKEYVALLHGKLEIKEGIVNVPLGRLPWNRERFGVLPGGRSSETRYKVNSHYKKGGNFYTLVTFYPKTGRTHQIRIHSKYIGHPIVSDDFYAGRKTSRKDREWCPRLFLHAYAISFNDPESGNRKEFRSELPYDLNSCLKLLDALD